MMFGVRTLGSAVAPGASALKGGLVKTVRSLHCLAAGMHGRTLESSRYGRGFWCDCCRRASESVQTSRGRSIENRGLA